MERIPRPLPRQQNPLGTGNHQKTIHTIGQISQLSHWTSKKAPSLNLGSGFRRLQKAIGIAKKVQVSPEGAMHFLLNLLSWERDLCAYLTELRYYAFCSSKYNQILQQRWPNIVIFTIQNGDGITVDVTKEVGRLIDASPRALALWMRHRQQGFETQGRELYRNELKALPSQAGELEDKALQELVDLYETQWAATRAQQLFCQLVHAQLPFIERISTFFVAENANAISIASTAVPLWVCAGVEIKSFFIGWGKLSNVGSPSSYAKQIAYQDTHLERIQRIIQKAPNEYIVKQKTFLDMLMERLGIDQPANWWFSRQNHIQSTQRNLSAERGDAIPTDIQPYRHSKTTKQRKRKPSARKRKRTLTPSTRPPETKMPTPPSSPTVREKQAPHPAQVVIQKPSTLKYHPRVQRWFDLKVEEFGKIRTFKRDGDNYGQCEDNELQEQHRFHGFSDFVDRIFRTRKNRDLYTWETEQGFEALGEFDYGGEGRERVSITYGVDFEKNVCFHRHCKPILSDQIVNRTWTSEEVVTPTLTGEEKSCDLERGWKGDSIDYDPTQQFYKILDRKHGCTIRIFRVNY